VTIPWTDDAPPARVSLLEIRAGIFVADRSAALTIKPAALVLTGLAAGDYSLEATGYEPVSIRVTAGNAVKKLARLPEPRTGVARRGGGEHRVDRP